jgi:hypothetical protein
MLKKRKDVKSMEEQEKNHPVKYLQMMSSSAHTYGNAVAFIQKWLIDLFPKRDNGDSIFRSINVSSKIAHMQLRRTPKEISKNTKPILAIRPRVDFQEDRFLQGTPLTDRLIYNQINFGRDGLQPFFFDRENKVAIKYQMNRTVMYIDVIMVFATLMQQLDYATFLKNSLPLNSPFDLDTCFESYLSVELMEMISELSGVPIERDGSIKPFLSYMNQHSNTPVTYKLQGSTNSKEFYRYYPAKVITTVQNMDVDDGERSGQISDDYRITMTIKMEFYSTGFYFLFSDKVFKIKKPSLPDDSSIIPIYTDVLLREDWQLKTGWCQYNRATCRLGKVHDTINFKSMLSPSIIAAVNHYVEKGYYLGEIIDIKIREQGRFMNPETEFKVDFNNFEIQFLNEDFGFFTYTIMICISPETINNLISKIFKLE